MRKFILNFAIFLLLLGPLVAVAEAAEDVAKPEKFETLSVLIFLLPGFAGVLAYSAIAEVEKQDNLDRIILALAFTLLSHTIYAAITDGKNLVSLLILSTEREKVLSRFATNLGMTTGIAIILGIFWAGIWNNALLFRAAARFGLTHRTGAIDVWHQSFSRVRGNWIRVRYKDGAILEGWAQFYSEDSDPMQLFVADAIWFFPTNVAKREDNSAEDVRTYVDAFFRRTALPKENHVERTQDEEYDRVVVEGPGVLLTDFADIRAIEHLNGAASSRETDDASRPA